MCGIAGILSKSGASVHPAAVRQMCDAMIHRGPDAEGFYADARIALGHRRLSIIDLSSSADQPFHDASGRYVIVFNGEMYNFAEVRRSLPDYPFKTHGDTEVLLAAFATWGPECISLFHGMFAFVIWDKQTETLFLFRDRLGVKPLYFHQDAEHLIFASELRAIMASGLVNRRLNRNALPDYFSYQSFGYPVSAVDGVMQLEAGSYLIVQKGQSQKHVYWSPGTVKVDSDLNNADVVKRKIRDLLSNAVAKRLVSDVPVGAFLSGGIDSSAVVGLMSEVSSARPSTFNISFEEKEYDESAYAEIIARKFNAKHTKLLLRPEDFLAGLGQALDAMDTPSADGVNTYMVSKAIREAGITVALSGVGGDELFAGYPYFLSHLKMQKWSHVFGYASPLRNAAAWILGKSHSGRAHRLASILRAERLDIAHEYPEFRRILSKEQIGRLTTFGSHSSTNLEMDLQRRRPVFERLPLLSQVSLAEYIGYTQQTLLKDTDQMSMAVSLEVREPFFDHELVDYVLQVPDKFKFPRYPKSLLVESLHPMLPDEIVHRKKQGFLLPWNVWMKNELRGFCEKSIGELCRTDFIHAPALNAYWKRFLDGDPSTRWTELWVFVVLGYWIEKNGIE